MNRSMVWLAALLALACGQEDREESIGPSGSADAAADIALDGISEAAPDASPDAPSDADGLEAGPTLGVVDMARYVEDLTFIAAERAPGSAHWQAVGDRCAARFQAYGYDVERHEYGAGVNIVGTRLGTKQPDSLVVLGAHYDSVPGCAAADDNGSGVAGLLEAARVLSTHEHERTLIVACWDEEESGMKGSSAYVQRAVERGDQVAYALAFEMIGYRSEEAGSQSLPQGFELLFPDQAEAIASNDNRGDFIAVIYDEHPEGERVVEAFRGVARNSALPVVGVPVPATMKNSSLLDDLRRSDHAPFWMADYPAAMITDTANFRNTHYHCTGGPDTVSRLDHAFATEVISATVGAVSVALSAD